MLVRTKVGIKPINQLANSDWFNDVVIHSTTDLEIGQIVLPYDFLKDQYTLIGKHIGESPHYDLIKRLDTNLPLENCEYVKRCCNGTLDFRKRIRISQEYLRNKYQERLNAMSNGATFSIKACLIYENTYMVADGKHSLVMAHYFNYGNVTFHIIQNLLFDTYTRWIFEKIRNHKDFRKHNEYFGRMYEYRKKETDRISTSRFDKQSD